MKLLFNTLQKHWERRCDERNFLAQAFFESVSKGLRSIRQHRQLSSFAKVVERGVPIQFGQEVHGKRPKRASFPDILNRVSLANTAGLSKERDTPREHLLPGKQIE